MVFLSSKGVGYWNVRKNTVQVPSPLSGYSGANYGDSKGNLSDDGKMLAILATRADGKTVAFAYILESGQKYPDIDLSTEYQVGWTTISPKGTYIVIYSPKSSTDAYQRRLVFTINGKTGANLERVRKAWPRRFHGRQQR